MLPKFLRNPDPEIYRSSNYVVVDFETTNLDKGDPLNEDNDIVLAYWTVVKGSDVKHRYCFGNEMQQQQLVDDINDADFMVAQNAKFELQWLYRCGLDLASVLVYDTMLAEYVIGGNKKRSLDLTSSAKRYGLGSKSSLVDKLIKTGTCPSDIPRKLLKMYCRQDVLLCHQLMQAQMEYISNESPRLLPIVYTRCLLTPVLADVERNGLVLDKEKVTEVRDEYLRELANVDKELYDINPDLNWNSPQQKAEYLYDELGFQELTDYQGEPLRTDKGARKTDADTIEALPAKTDIQRRVVDLIQRRNKYSSALSKALNFFYGVCEDYNCTFRGVFNQAVTSTHRLSSSGRRLAFPSLEGKEYSAQLQNLARDFKDLFTASASDRVIGEVDGSQLEFRVAGHLGRDSQVRHDIVNEVDIHAYTAETLTAAGEDTNRQAAKASTFRPLYGGSSGTPAVQAYCKAFKEKYRELSDTQEGWARTAAATKKLETEWGMVYYFPYARVTPSGYIKESTKIYNFPIQAFATAEIIPISLVYFWHRTRGTDIKVVNTVHDSIICDFPRELTSEFSRISSMCMINDVEFYLVNVYDVDMTVPLGAGIKVGDHWNTADKSLAYAIMEGIEEAGFIPDNDKGEDVEFKCESHKRIF